MRSYTRLSATLAGLLLAVSNPLAAMTVKGVILANEMGGLPIADVRVGALGVDTVSSLYDGSFVLDLPNKRPGDKVQLFVQEPGMEVVNYFELRFTLPRDENAEPLILLLCPANERQEMTRRFFRLDRFDPIEQRYQKKLEDLQVKNQTTEMAKEPLRIERDRAKEVELHAAEELARIKVEEVYYFYAHPTSSDYRSDAAMALNSLGIMYRHQNRADDARRAFDKALEISSKLAQQDRATYLPDVEETLNNLGNMLSDQNQNEAKEAYDKALKIGLELAEQNRAIYGPGVASTLNELGTLFRKHGRLDEARTAFEEALKWYRALEKMNLATATYRPRVVETLKNIGTIYQDQNQLKEALTAFSEVLTIYETLARGNPGLYAQEAQEVESTYGQVLGISRKLAQQNRATYLPVVALTLNNRGTFLRRQNWMDKAQKDYYEALDISRELAQQDPDAHLQKVADTLTNIGNLKLEQNRAEEARTVSSEALAIEGLFVYETLARELAKEKVGVWQHAPEVESTYEALEISRKLAQQGPDTYLPKIALLLINFGMSKRGQMEPENARTAFRKAIAVYENLTATNPELYGQKIESARRMLDDLNERQKVPAAISGTGQPVPKVTVRFVLVLQSEVCKGSYKPGDNDCPVTAETAAVLKKSGVASRVYPLREGKLEALSLEPKFQHALIAGIDARDYAVLLEFDWGSTLEAVSDIVSDPGRQLPEWPKPPRHRSRYWYTHQNASYFEPAQNVEWQVRLNCKNGKFSYKFHAIATP